MGQYAVKAIAEDPHLTLVGQLTRHDDLALAMQKQCPQVVVDLTTPAAVFPNSQLIIEHQARPVIGTSGLTAPQINSLQQQAKKQNLGGLIVPNFSLGAVLMMRFAKLAAPYFPHAEIIEKHHPDKKDAPSGTAIKTAAMIEQARPPLAPSNCRETLAGARGTQTPVPIHALRLSGLVAEQQVIFGGASETLTIQHNTMDRKAFMPGLLLACKKVMELNELIYGLEEVID
jgi:4-hydroxy-tetrahydrodipicolinate reductase